MYRREQYHTLMERMAEPRKFIQVIAGPRQVGKSTLVKQVMQDCSLPYTLETADAINSENGEWIANVWESVRQQMSFRQQTEHLLVIDEIHKIKNWSEQIKREWDNDTFNDRNIKVILLGSSRLLLKKGLTESLMGRFELIRMPHWSLREMHDAFGWDINQYIYFGGYPGGATLISNERRWRQYVQDAIIAPSIEKDVILTSTIYKPTLMRNLFELGCSYSGEELSLNKVLGQLQDAGNVTTLSNYLEILNECNLLAGLQKYAADKARKYNSIPKFQTYNSALLSALNGNTYEQAFTDTKLWGRWVETAIGAHLINHADAIGYRLYYWREANNEVDYVLERQGRTIAIEVKSGRRTTNKGISLFRERFHPLHTIIVGSGGFPIADFLEMDLERLWR
ncbi:MAG: ATP-binding protein [Bacteroidaceae bacterium]|nr:ATP-binding protein [Bacteroidaceae bacterium]MBR3896286.1 ATP-binding protein [Bacteroidaceae bacterium]